MSSLDVCNFNVPEFVCEQQLRVRIKVHSTKNSKGLCKLSVILSCKPKNLQNLLNSPYSLDNKWKLPKNLLIIPEEDDYKIEFKNISPLRYPGGKTRACKILDQIISEHFHISNFDTLLSPFFGGGSFEFFFQNKYNHHLCVNDKFSPLSNFWKQVKKDKTTLCTELRKIDVVSKDDFIKYRNSVILEKDMLQQAKQYFILFQIFQCWLLGDCFIREGGFLIFYLCLYRFLYPQY